MQFLTEIGDTCRVSCLHLGHEETINVMLMLTTANLALCSRLDQALCFMESVTNRGPLDQLVNELGIEELRGFLEDFLLRVDGDDSGSLWTKTLHENFAEAL